MHQSKASIFTRQLMVFCLSLSLASAITLSLSSAYADNENFGGSNSGSGGEGCSDEADTATSACTDPNSTAGMDGNGLQALDAAHKANSPDALAGVTGQAEVADRKAKADQTIADVSRAKVQACDTTATSCKDKCSAVISRLKAKLAAGGDSSIQQKISSAESKAQKCDAMQAKNSSQGMGQMMQALASMLQALAAMKAASQASPTATPMDCTNPSYALSNQVCICSTPGSVAYAPKSTVCNNTSQIGAGPSMNNMNGPATPTDSGGNIGTGDNGSFVPPAGDGKPASGTNAGNGEGGGGGGIGGGGGRGGGTNPDGGGAPGSNVDKSVITGQAGGGGGGSGGGGGGSSGTGSHAGGSGSGFGSFDLGKYLPGKKDYKNRGLASVGFQSKDGITGPMGPSIWEKVANQYQQQKAKQNLILDK